MRRPQHRRQISQQGFARTCSTTTHKNGSIYPTHDMLLTKALQIDTNNLNRRHMTVGDSDNHNVKDTRDDIELGYEQTEDRDDRDESPREEDQRIKADTNAARMVVVSTVVKAPPASPAVENNKVKQNSFSKILKKSIKKSLMKRVSKKKNKVDRVVSVQHDDTRDELVNNNRFKPVDGARDVSVDDTLDEEEGRSTTPTVIDFGDWFTTPKPPPEIEKTSIPLEEKKESTLVTVEEEDDESSEGSITSEINSINSEKKKMERTPSISSRQSSRSGRSTPVAFILESWGDESVNDCLDNRHSESPVLEVEDDETKNPAQVLEQGLDLKRLKSSPLAAFGRQRSNPISTFKSMSMGKQEREELIKLIKFNAQLEKKKVELERQKIELDKEMLARYAGSDDSTKLLSRGSSDYSASLASSNEYGSYSLKETRESFDGESWASFFHGERSAVSDGNTSFMNKIFGSFLCSCGEKEKETYNDRLAMM